MILDASAMIAFFADEPEALAIRILLADEDSLAMSTVNLTEVMLFLHRTGRPDPTVGLRRMHDLGIEFVPPDLPPSLLAAESRNRFRISFGDRFCYALAKVRDEPILTLDADFARTDARLVPLA